MIVTLLALAIPIPFPSTLAAAVAVASPPPATSSSSATPLFPIKPSAQPGLVWAKKRSSSNPPLDPRQADTQPSLHYCTGPYTSPGTCGGPCSTTNGTNGGSSMCMPAPYTRCVAVSDPSDGGRPLDWAMCMDDGCERCTSWDDLNGEDVGGYRFFGFDGQGNGGTGSLFIGF
ncbi:MAG: hypothetical protein Q9227_000778 [Pyrenula ochraceoflavens]